MYKRQVKGELFGLLYLTFQVWGAEAVYRPRKSREKIKQKMCIRDRNYSKDFRSNEVLQYIAQHFREDISLSDVAAVFGLSPNYFSSLFKKKTGRNFVHYLAALRIEEGKRLLLETSMTVREISAATGYYSASFFIRSFKKSEGLTPFEYRKSHNML